LVRDFQAIEAPALAVPAEDRLRPDQVKVLLPAIGPDGVQPYPQDAISRLESRMRILAQRDLKLMSKRQVLQHQLAPRAEASQETTSDEEQHDEHGSG